MKKALGGEGRGGGDRRIPGAVQFDYDKGIGQGLRKEVEVLEFLWGGYLWTWGAR